MNWTNIIYVLFWGAVSFVASFMFVLDGQWNQIISTDLLKGVLSPFFLWITAFFGDYIYGIIGIDKKTHILNPFWVKFSYFVIEAIFIILIGCIYWDTTEGRTTCVILLFMCLLGLKTASLYAVCPRQKIEKS